MHVLEVEFCPMKSRQKSKIVDLKPEVFVSQPVDMIQSKTVIAMKIPCFRSRTRY